MSGQVSLISAASSEYATGLSTPTYKRVTDLLRGDILSGRFSPGARLKIADLSRAYGVSQMPVREALQQLQGENLVDILPNRGASVRTVDERVMINIYDLRCAIESMLVGRTAAIIDGAQIVQLYALEERFEDAISSNDAEETMKANKAFHHALNSIADNPEALAILEKYSDLINGLRRVYGFRPGRGSQMLSEHRELLAALAAHNSDEASRITLEHVRHAKDDLVALLQDKATAV